MQNEKIKLVKSIEDMTVELQEKGDKIQQLEANNLSHEETIVEEPLTV